MGGGPASADVVQSSCLLTFPEEAGAEPVPVDAWYLHAVGLTFLRRLARDRVGDTMRIALLMQQAAAGDEDDDAAAAADESEEKDESESKRPGDDDDQQQQPTAPSRPKRYVSVSSDAVLRSALQETFDHPEKVLVLHVISLEKVPGAKSIHVRPEINPNVSPEPVAPMALVFPTLHVEGAVTRVPAASASLLAMSSSYALSKSVYVPPRKEDGVFDGHTLAHSTPALVEEREYTWRGSSQQQQEAPSPATAMASGPPQKPASLAALAVATQISDGAGVDLSEIPVARVVGHVDDSQSSLSTASSESDYVMLELQTGAGMGEQSAPSSTYFISSMWHVQAEEMSASMRLPAASRRRRQQDAEASGSSSSHSSNENGAPQQSQQDDRVVPVAAAAIPVRLEDSFVMLERHPRE